MRGREGGGRESLAQFCHLTAPGNGFDRTIFIATRGNYGGGGVGALIRHADSGRGTFSSADRMIVRILCAVAFGSWQFGAGISCQRVAEPMKSLCQGENASVGFRHYFLSFSPRLLLPLLHHPVFSLSPPPPPFSLTSLQRRSIGRGGRNNQRKFDGNIRMRSSDRAMCSDMFEYRLSRHAGRRRCARSINSNA